MNVFEQAAHEQRTIESTRQLLWRRGWRIQRSHNWLTGRVTWRATKAQGTVTLGYRIKMADEALLARSILETCNRLDRIFDRPAAPPDPTISTRP